MILTQGAQMAGNRKGFEDFQREAEEFEARRQARLLQQQMGQTKLESAKFELERAKTAQPDRFGGTGQFSTIANVAYRDALAQGLDQAAAEKLAIDKALQASPQYQLMQDPSNPYGPPVPVPMPRPAIFGSQMPQPTPQQPQQMPDYGRTPDFVPPEFETRDLPQPNVPQTEYTDVMQGDQLAPIPQGYSAPSVNEAFAPMDANTAQQIQELFPTPVGAEMVTPFTPQPNFTPIPQSDFTPIPMPQPMNPRSVGIPVDPRAATSPDVNVQAQKDINQANISLQKEAIQGDLELYREFKKMSYSDQLKKADEMQKTEEGRNRVAGIISRMKQINDGLKEKGAIVSLDQPLLSRFGTALETTGVGQAQRKVTDPEAQALADEYTKLQATLLPFFAKASGLGAKSLDSEGERKSIMGSFGDPSGIYEANQRQLQNLEQVFGVAPAPQQAPIGAPSPQGQRLRYNPATGRLE